MPIRKPQIANWAIDYIKRDYESLEVIGAELNRYPGTVRNWLYHRSPQIYSRDFIAAAANALGVKEADVCNEKFNIYHVKNSKS